MFLEAEYLPVLGSLVAGGLLFATVIVAVVYGWIHAAPSQAAACESMKKAA